MRFQNEVVINQGRERVFAYIANVQKATEWNYAVIRVEEIQRKKDIIGSEYVLVRMFANKEARDHIVVTQHLPGQRFAVESIAGGPFPYGLEYNFADKDGATVVTNKARFKPRGFKGMLASLAVPRIKKEVFHNLCIMKKIVESG
uniref:SRPBCC family protein n=1 Tax=Kroppenstedtia sanguinis TaxID=1380684 RepID=UPI003D21E11B